MAAFSINNVGFTSSAIGAAFPMPHTVLSTQNFGSGLTTNNPSQHASCSISEPVPGQRFLAVGNQDMSQTFTSGRKGCIEVFKETGGQWVWHQRLISPLTRSGQWMGHALRSGNEWILCGNTHSVGNPSGGEGEIEAWKYNSGTGFYAYDHLIQPDDCLGGDEFGMLMDVDFESGWMIAGSPQLHDYSSTTGGKIYFYKLIGSTWTQMQSFIEPGWPFADSAYNDNAFGLEVHVRGNHAFASSTNVPGTYYKGSLYHYMLNNGIWEYIGPITPPSHRVGMRFGSTLHFDGSRLVSFDWGLKWYQGGFTTMKWNGSGWTHEQTYIHPWGEGVNSTENHRFGHKGLYINGDTLVASERFAFGTWEGVNDMNGPEDAKGIVFVFKRIGTKWRRTHTILPDSVQPGDWFGDLMTWDPVKNCLIVVSTGATRNSAKTMVLNEIQI